MGLTRMVLSDVAKRLKAPHALWPKNQNIKQMQYCDTFNKDFLSG